MLLTAATAGAVSGESPTCATGRARMHSTATAGSYTIGRYTTDLSVLTLGAMGNNLRKI